MIQPVPVFRLRQDFSYAEPSRYDNPESMDPVPTSFKGHGLFCVNSKGRGQRIRCPRFAPGSCYLIRIRRRYLPRQVTASDPDQITRTWSETWAAYSLPPPLAIDAEKTVPLKRCRNRIHGLRIVVSAWLGIGKILPQPEDWYWLNHAESVQIRSPDEMSRQRRVIRDEKRKIAVYSLRTPGNFRI